MLKKYSVCRATANSIFICWWVDGAVNLVIGYGSYQPSRTIYNLIKYRGLFKDMFWTFKLCQIVLSPLFLVLIYVMLDPPLYTLSWNLKDSHVFSGSFWYIKMSGKTRNSRNEWKCWSWGGLEPPRPFKSQNLAPFWWFLSPMNSVLFLDYFVENKPTFKQLQFWLL